MEYSSTPYVGMARGENGSPYNAYQIIRSELALIIVIGISEPYHNISSVFISNRTVGVARKPHWSARPASRHTGGRGLMNYFWFLSSARLAQ